jgi:hypothetical protein
LESAREEEDPIESGSDSATHDETSVDGAHEADTADTAEDAETDGAVDSDSGSPEAETKWFPGHYIFVGDSPSIEGTYNHVGTIPAVRGVQVRYYWDDLEPSKDEYDLTPIWNDLDLLSGMNWKLIIQVQFRIFGNGTQSQRIPDYLKTSSYDGGAYYDAQGNSTVLLGNDNVRTRFVGLLEQLGEAFDAHPMVAGVNLPESGIAKPDESHPLFAVWDQYRDDHWQNLLLCDVAGRQAFATTPFVQYFGQGGTDTASDFESLSKQHGFGIGNPDVILRGFEEDIWVSHNYHLAMDKLLGFVPLMYSVQSPDYPANATYLGEDNPVPETFRVLREELQTNFVTWGQTWGENEFYWGYVADLLTSLSTVYPDDPSGGLNASCPSLLAPCAPDP